MTDRDGTTAAFAHEPGRPTAEARAIQLARAAALEAKGDHVGAAEARHRADKPGPHSQARRDAMRRAENVSKSTRDD